MLVHLQYFLYSKRDAIFAAVLGLSFVPSVFLMCYILFEWAVYKDAWIRIGMVINCTVGMLLLPVTIAYLVDTIIEAVEDRISKYLWENSEEYKGESNGDEQP